MEHNEPENKRLDDIKNLTFRILDEVGIRLHRQDMVAFLAQKGVRVEGDIIFFSKSQALDLIALAPESFQVHGPNPHHNMIIGGDNVQCAPAYGSSSIIDAKGNKRDALLSDHLNFVKLVHQSSHFNINGGILAQPSDVPAELSHLIMHHAALTHSDKCIMGMPGTRQQMEEIMELSALRMGGREELMARPHVITMVSPISPLQIDTMGLDSIEVAATWKQPIIASPGVAAGTTGPIDLASNLAMASAESLAVILIAQIINPGTPVLFGLQCYGADMKSGNISIGSPAYALQAKYCAALARSYRLPSRAGGTTNDALDLSAQSGYESMLSMFTACQNKVNLIVHSAGVLNSFAGISYEKFIMDLEIMDAIQFYLDDLNVNDDTLNFDLIKEIGHGGLYITSMDTMKKCRTHTWNPKTALRGSLMGMLPGEKFLDNIEQQKKEMLSQWVKPEIPKGVKVEMEQYLETKGIDPKIFNTMR